VASVARIAAGIACAMALTAAAQETLGTLFLTPQERARLDRLRRGEPVAEQGAAAVANSDPQLTGYVQRSDGRTTVWVDGRALSLPPRSAPRLEPSAVNDERSDSQGVRIERQPRR
jgi:hypothetical protein